MEKFLEEITSKIVLDEERLKLASDYVDRVLNGIFTAVGFPEDIYVCYKSPSNIKKSKKEENIEDLDTDPDGDTNE